MADTPRVLYIPNETPGSSQVGFRRAFGALRDASLLDVRVCSMTRRMRAGISDHERRRLRNEVAEFCPTHILLQHADGMGLSRSDILGWKKESGAFLIYHEADPYGLIRNRTPLGSVVAARAADVVFLTGASSFARKFRVFGGSDVRWIFQGYDPGSFGLADVPTEKSFESVIIANRGRSRVPFMGHPGARERSHFIRLAQESLGSDLALYGGGWDGESARGTVDFWRQGDQIAKSWTSLNWDHYPQEAKYFSNRLAISLASGSVHFTTWHPGYENIFPCDARFIFFARRPQDLIKEVRSYLVSTSLDQRLMDIRAGMEWADDNLRQDDLLRALLLAGGIETPRKILGGARNASRSPLQEW